jgi:3-deoxy-D-manno-octulosonic-acid transferase
MESDFWPNLITQAKASGIPVIFASSQLSARAAARWQTRLGIANIMFGAADLALPVNQEQADTLTALGTDPKVITVLGSLKMAMNALPVDDELVTQLGKAIGKRRIFLAASTHEGEDEIILDVAKKLGNDWLVIIAPRHPSRGPDIAKLCKNHGFAVTMRSGATTSAQLCSEISPGKISLGEISVEEMGAGGAPQLLLMDSLGEMGSLFTVADIVFLAGSLLPIGGHNPLEPASFGKPIISGPHVFKNSAEFDAMRKAGIVKDADNAAAIAAAATQLWDDKEGRKAMSHAAITYAKNASKRQSVAATKIISILNRKAGAR